MQSPCKAALLGLADPCRREISLEQPNLAGAKSAYASLQSTVPRAECRKEHSRHEHHMVRTSGSLSLGQICPIVLDVTQNYLELCYCWQRNRWQPSEQLEYAYAHACRTLPLPSLVLVCTHRVYALHSPDLTCVLCNRKQTLCTGVTTQAHTSTIS